MSEFELNLPTWLSDPLTHMTEGLAAVADNPAAALAALALGLAAIAALGAIAAMAAARRTAAATRRCQTEIEAGRRDLLAVRTSLARLEDYAEAAKQANETQDAAPDDVADGLTALKGQLSRVQADVQALNTALAEHHRNVRDQGQTLQRTVVSLREEIVQQQTAKYRVNEAIRRAMGQKDDTPS